MLDILSFLEEEGVDKALLDGVKAFRAKYPTEAENAARVPAPEYLYYGKKTWELALAAILAGKNLLLAGPKATGKNVLSENLGALFGRPVWNVSFHINTDASYLVGTDTYDGHKVSFRPGPIWLSWPRTRPWRCCTQRWTFAAAWMCRAMRSSISGPRPALSPP